MHFTSRFGSLLLFAGLAISSPVATPTEPDPSQAVSVELNGQTFINKGLVAFGLIPSNATESTGDTIGGIGSAIAFKRGTFMSNTDGTFSGTLTVQPDRGFNVDGTVDYQGRQFDIDFVLTPYYGTADLSFDDALQTLSLTYIRTLLYTERNDTKTTGLDALAVRAADSGFPQDPTADPPLPIPSQSFNRLTLDCEGLVLNADGTFWMSDEYGPYIYRFASDGSLIQVISPPDAILPMVKNKLNFTSMNDPDTGRAGNQGFEGLTVSPNGNTLFALLQSATIQDGGNKKSTSRFTRLLSYDVSDLTVETPALIGEWVVPLPQDSSGDTLAQSEMHFISENVFFVLARDANGHGGNSDTSAYKQADLIDISGATDIHDTEFDDPSNPIASKGKLDKSITPALYVPFVNFINNTQLARFGLHNGSPADQTLIDAKWESLALAPVNDPANPNDYFLFTAADNDFLSTQGVFNGMSFNAGLDNDNQFLVFRVTLPTVTAGSVQEAIGI
ncbi:hypothetical protein SCHPADRAFT_901583 [Schizopora paradoxa]|uniref:Phytase-like domain-containing protein n=1 Tax=Schizopora paradoxa TaxID=27342 RepID=A0A0H2S3P3_9AGAM|nr:hypothetical protein SCHPADRAFT_901583 [Schizopora paradoxa]